MTTTRSRTVVPRWLLLSVATCAFVAGATSASAQVDIELVPQERAPGLVFTPSVGFGVLYDNNVIIAGEGDPRPDDSIIVARPAFDIALTKKHTNLSVGYFGAMMRYHTLDQYDTFNQGARLEFEHQHSRRLRLYARDRFSVNPSTDAAIEPGVPFIRTGTRQNTVEGGATFAATERLNLDGSYQFQWLEFDQTLRPIDALLQGGYAHRVMFTARQRVAEHVSVGGNVGIQHAIIAGGTESSDIQNAEAVVVWQLAPSVRIEGGGGLSHVVQGALGSHVGPAGHVSIKKQTEYAVFSAGASRSYRPSFGSTRSVQNQELRAGVYVPFAARRAFAAAEFIRHKNEGIVDPGLTLSANWLHATLGYVFNRWVRVEGYYAGALQDTNVPGGRVQRNRVGVQIVTSAPMRIE